MNLSQHLMAILAYIFEYVFQVLYVGCGEVSITLWSYNVPFKQRSKIRSLVRYYYIIALVNTYAVFNGKVIPRIIAVHSLARTLSRREDSFAHNCCPSIMQCVCARILTTDGPISHVFSDLTIPRTLYFFTD